MVTLKMRLSDVAGTQLSVFSGRTVVVTGSLDYLAFFGVVFASSGSSMLAIALALDGRWLSD